MTHDSGLSETSDGGTAKITPLLNTGQDWTHPNMIATNSPEYLNALETLADKQIQVVMGLDKDYAHSSLTLLAKIQEGFSATGGVSKTFVEKMTALPLEFFCDARGYEVEITTVNTVAF